MFLIDGSRTHVPQAVADANQSFPDGTRISATTAEKIYGILAEEIGEGFRWCFPDAQQILWDWNRLLHILENGAGWTLPSPMSWGIEANSRLIVQFVDRGGAIFEPICFIAKPIDDVLRYELSGALTSKHAPVRIRKLAVDLNEAIKAQKSNRDNQESDLLSEISDIVDFDEEDLGLDDSSKSYSFGALLEALQSKNIGRNSSR